MLKKWLIRISILILWPMSIVYMYGLGAFTNIYEPDRSAKYVELVRPLVMMFVGHSPCDAEDTTTCGFKDASEREEVSCSRFTQNDPRQAILFTFGQSNSANAGQSNYIPKQDVVNFNPHDGKCYVARDPMLGPDGEQGSVWGVVADKLIEQGTYDSVMVIPFGIGGTEIARWIPGGDLHARVKWVAKQLKAQNISPTHVLWHQGENDAALKTSQQDYTRMFGDLLQAVRDYGIEAPVYPAVASYCGMQGVVQSEDVRQAQRELPELFENVKLGPNTDEIQGRSYRHDDCHFSADGMQLHADLWIKAITQQ